MTVIESPYITCLKNGGKKRENWSQLFLYRTKEEFCTYKNSWADGDFGKGIADCFKGPWKMHWNI